MSTDPTDPTGVGPGLDTVRRRAKQLKRDVRDGDAEALERVHTHHPKYAGQPRDWFDPDRMTLRDAQVVLARELGFDGWRDLVAAARPTRARWPERSDLDLLRRSFAEAQRHGHTRVGADHVLLALLAPDVDSRAARVLRQAGLTYDEVLDRLSHRAVSSDGGVGTTPAWHAFSGVARGLALAAGRVEVSDDDALVAIIDEAPYRLDHVLDGFDVTALELAEAARGAGLVLPDLDPAETSTPLGPMGPRVFVPEEHATTVRAALFERFGTTTFWGVNRTPDGRPYFVGERETRLVAVITDILGAPSLVESEDFPWS